MVCVRVSAELQKLQAPREKRLITGFCAGIACISQIGGHFLDAVFREEEADRVGRSILCLVVIEAARGCRITVREDRFQSVQYLRAVILRSVGIVITVTVGAFHAHLQAVGRLACFHDRVRRCAEVAPYAVIFLEVHKRLVGGEDMHIVGKSRYRDSRA